MSELAKLEENLARLAQANADTGTIHSAADRVLAVSPQHSLALRCKVVCCIHAEKFGAAMAALDTLQGTGKSGLSSTAAMTCQFQRAYCLYRMRRYAEAKAVLTATAHGSLRDHVPSRHLLAQVHYNMEAFPEAAVVYRSLLDGGAFRDEEERAELETNYSAALAGGPTPRAAVELVHASDDKTSDLVYNAGTALIEARDFPAAMKTLQQAEALYAREHPKSRIRTLKDALALGGSTAAAAAAAAAEVFSLAGSPERRFFNDVVNTWVQMAYAHYATGDEAAAADILSVVLAGSPASAVTGAIAAINWNACRRGADGDESGGGGGGVATASKPLRAAQHEKIASRLTSQQNAIVRYNIALLHFNAGSGGGADHLGSCRRIAEAMARDFPASELTQSLRLAVAARETKGKQQSVSGGIDALLKDFTAAQSKAGSSSSSSYQTVLLIAAQVYAANGDLAKALEVLEGPVLLSSGGGGGGISATPSGIATRAAWRVRLGDATGAVDLVADSLPSVRSVATQRALLAWATHFLSTTASTTPAPTSSSSFSSSSSSTGTALAVELVKRARASIPALASDREVTALLGLCLATDSRLEEARACLANIIVAVGGGDKLKDKEVNALAKGRPARTAVEQLGFHRPGAAAAATNPDDDGSSQQHQLRKRRARPMRRPPRVIPEKGEKGNRPDPERWIPMNARLYVKELSERKRKDMKRLRGLDQEQKRKAAEKRRVEAAVAAAAAV